MNLRTAGACALILLLFPTSGRSEIFGCIGPNGELLFTDRGCPPPYSLRGTTPAPPGGAGAGDGGEWSRSCEDIPAMDLDEVGDATARVRELLRGARQGDPAGPGRWEQCLAHLVARQGALQADGASDRARTRPPAQEDRAGDRACREGTFATENHGTFYDVYFTNASREECRSVSAYCLCSVSFGLYRQSREIVASGSFAPGTRTKIASISPTGPSGAGIDWSWCKFRY